MTIAAHDDTITWIIARLSSKNKHVEMLIPWFVGKRDMHMTLALL